VAFDPALVGVWAKKDDKETWAFTKRDEKSYKLVYTEKDGKSGEFIVHLVKLAGATFLDLFPEDPKLTQPAFYQAHLLPAHTFILVPQIAPTLRLSFLSPDWLKKFLTSNPTAIKYEKLDDRIVLTAQPQDLQKFLLSHLKATDAFSEPAELERAKPK
jgi:hypothetical protein